MNILAGYVIEELLDPSWYFRYEDWDHLRVLDMLREFSPRKPDDGIRLLALLRDRTRRLLIRPEVMEELIKVADLLLEQEEVGGSVFYLALYNGNCSARHPDLSEVRCQLSPHRFGTHFWQTRPSSVASPIIWDGLPTPPRNQRVGAMTPSQKRIRAINLGLAPRPLSKAWREALDGYAWDLAGI